LTPVLDGAAGRKNETILLVCTHNTGKSRC
jgi:hypothetical protein